MALSFGKQSHVIIVGSNLMWKIIITDFNIIIPQWKKCLWLYDPPSVQLWTQN